ncbi:helix-turn-helix transcriptional regulator [Verticiella sediminum]|uniref:Helix-turn-helix transcriptional regulator n=1 Tax=Verticiella sediminum TaxID=1247510 RepID=A0A556AJ08_9BURK|nr:helix-turn-helix transcriptional regulator [Verticiella sediminum]TSH92850.1 helix-turn-helix transcriptional regulator [Verticiella sediminum]
MSSDAEFEQDRIFKALSHRRRRELLDRLRDGPQTTGALCAAFADMDRCTVMLHLRVLADAGLVVSRRQGRERWNYLNALPIRHIHDRWISEYASPAVELLVRLDAAPGDARAAAGRA